MGCIRELANERRWASRRARSMRLRSSTCSMRWPVCWARVTAEEQDVVAWHSDMLERLAPRHALAQGGYGSMRLSTTSSSAFRTGSHPALGPFARPIECRAQCGPPSSADKAVIATINRPAGDTGVHTHTAALLDGLRARIFRASFEPVLAPGPWWLPIFGVRQDLRAAQSELVNPLVSPVACAAPGGEPETAYPQTGRGRRCSPNARSAPARRCKSARNCA